MTTEIHYRTCNLCEAMCGLAIEHNDGQVLSIHGDKQDPLSRGHICPKAVALQDLHNDPDRLRQPMKRVGNQWHPLSWQEALDETAARLQSIRKQHGRDATAIYVGNPTAHNHGALLMLVPLLKALGTRNRYSATSVDQLPQMLACLTMLGNHALFPIPDIDRTDFFLILGANPMASNGSIMTAPDMRNRLKDINKRGGRVVVIDPRRTETAKVANEHQFIRPGTDAWLLLGLLHVIFRDDLTNTTHLDAFLDGKTQLAGLVADWAPERVAKLTGIDASVIERIAHEFANAKGASAYCRVGTCTSAFSAISTWLVYALNVITGNLDRPGGLMFPKPAMDVVEIARLTGETGSFDRYRSRVKQLPEFAGEFPVITLADEILTPGNGQVRALVTHAGNPVLSCPDGKHLDNALESLDFMVSIDLYINETTRHADIILPPTGHLEHAQFDPVFHAVAVRNTIKFSPALFPPAKNALHDWEILLELITRLNNHDLRSGLQAKGFHWLVKRLGDTGIIDLALRSGPYGSLPSALNRIDNLLSRTPLAGPSLKRRWESLKKHYGLNSHQSEDAANGKLTLKKVINEPHGIDLGPLQPALPERLGPGGKIQLFPRLYRHQLEQLNIAAEKPTGDQWLLIGRRHVRSNNSWMHNSHRLVKGKSRCDLMLHPKDAVKLGVEQGDLVIISTATGQIQLPASVSEDIMPGVVSAPHGWGHQRVGVALSVASQQPGASINDVIGSDSHDPMTGMAIINGVPVKLRPAMKRQKKNKNTESGNQSAVLTQE